MSDAAAPQRIGVFGGAFDPPHLAHVALARAAIEQLRLDRLHIVPTGSAWHKARPLSDAEHRLAMSQLAFAPLAQAFIDESELRRSGPSYTVDTLTALAARYPQAALFLVIGGDQAAALPTWHRWQELFRLATIAVALRDPSTLASDGFFSEYPALAPFASRIQRLRLPLMPLSATLVRERIAAGLPVAELLPPAVARYIESHRLYAAHV